MSYFFTSPNSWGYNLQQLFEGDRSYPLVMTNIANWKITIERVDLSIKTSDFPVRYVSHYQRVGLLKTSSDLGFPPKPETPKSTQQPFALSPRTALTFAERTHLSGPHGYTCRHSEGWPSQRVVLQYLPSGSA